MKSEFAKNKRALLDYGFELRERRLALSGVPEKDGEDPVSVALNAVNKILTHAVNQSKTPVKPTGARPKLRTLKIADIDSVYRAGSSDVREPGYWLSPSLSSTYAKWSYLLNNS